MRTPAPVIAIRFIACVALSLFLNSCSIQQKIASSARENIVDAKPLETAHVGISIYDAGTGKYLFDYQGDKYFVPASNMKIPTCYAAMKYLGDSLEGIRFNRMGDILQLRFTGDPSFLHPDFPVQPVYQFLRSSGATSIQAFTPGGVIPFGNGWAWNDYDQDYMPERSAFPIYGNVVRFGKTPVNAGQVALDTAAPFGIHVVPAYFKDFVTSGNSGWKDATAFSVDRPVSSNDFFISPHGSAINLSVPFTHTTGIVGKLLSDTIRIPVSEVGSLSGNFSNVIHSIAVDSLLTPMMHRSDNFFAEQVLLMVADKLTGRLSERSAIDTILKTEFKDLPQAPRWADGSGLSRYNLFSPRDFVFILGKMKKEFGMERIRTIFPTGGEGTFSNYYKSDQGFIYAKTGSLSGVICISGFLDTKKGRELIFSVLVNNHRASASDVRRAVEKFLQGIRERY